MDDQLANLRSRELGLACRAAMEARGLSGLGIAKLLDWSQPRVSRLLSGKRGTRPVDVAAFLAHCQVTGSERDRLIELAEEQRKEDWLQQFGARVPEQVRTYVDHELRATAIQYFSMVMVPGILQTEGYARALIARNANVPPEELEARVQARLARRRIFNAERPPNYTFFIHEVVLWLAAGSNAVMSDQLHDLLRMSVRDRIGIRIIPRSSGVHAGMAGSFVLLSSGEYQPVVYLEGETTGTFLEKTETINAYRNVWKSLTDAALDDLRSRELIGNLALELYSSAEGEDGHG